MRVLSLFDGMSCGVIAMQAAGIPADRYVAYEIDKYAVQTSSHNFPMIEHRGDVFLADFTEFSGFDFLIGGSPCTHWSIAKNNRETEASGIGWELFSQYVRALHEAMPKFFIYENNKSMSKAIRESIDKAFGFEAVCINSDLVSAQNRQRLYWVGKRNEDGTYGKVHVEQPEDLGILLKDVFGSGGKTYPAYQVCSFSHPHGWNKGIFTYEKFPNLTTGSSCRQQNVLIEPLSSKNEHLLEQPQAFCNQKYEVKDGYITIKGKRYPVKLADGFYIIRKLTVSECKRLQMVPEWYEFPVSDSQAYKMLGNGWTVDVIAHLIKATQIGRTADVQLDLTEDDGSNGTQF